MPIILFILFLVIPILEIAAFIQVGSLIGLFPTLASIVLTAVIGAYLVRWQGIQTLDEARQASAHGELPVGPLFHGVFILLAGILLLTPGFVTDAIGFLLLVPALRRVIGAWVWNSMKDKVEIHTAGGRYAGEASRRRGTASGTVIDVDAVDITEDTDENREDGTTSTPKGINHDAR